jgi:tetratricopeptide (TPR) repeat protein
MKPTLELSMIVKDGAPVLARCLRSTAPFVDRISIGDTGSTDESAAIARSFGAKVLAVPWEDNFSRARNQVLSQAECDWILVLDADEMLDASGGAQIRMLIETPEIFAYHNPRWNYMRDASTRLGFQAARPNPVVLEESRSYPAYVPLPTTRLFRNYPGVYYEGCVHETVTRRLAALGLTTARADFIVHHFGHAEDAEIERQKKNNLYQVLGEKKLKTNENDAQAYIEMGLAELENARRPAVALVHFERARALSPQSPVAWLFAGACLVRLMKLPEALERLDRAASLGLRNAVLYQTLGDAHFHAARYSEARNAYAQVAALGEASPLSEAKLGACEIHLGSVVEGIGRMKQAVSDAPEFGELYDMLAAGALLSGDVELAARTAEARLRLGHLTEFHVQLAALVQAKLKERQKQMEAPSKDREASVMGFQTTLS